MYCNSGGSSGRRRGQVSEALRRTVRPIAPHSSIKSCYRCRLPHNELVYMPSRQEQKALVESYPELLAEISEGTANSPATTYYVFRANSCRGCPWLQRYYDTLPSWESSRNTDLLWAGAGIRYVSSCSVLEEWRFISGHDPGYSESFTTFGRKERYVD